MKIYKQFLIGLLSLVLFTRGYSQECAITPIVVNESCVGSGDGSITLDLSSLSCVSEETSCGVPELPSEDWCSTCTSPVSPGDVEITTEICLTDGYNGPLSMGEGARVIICGTVTITNINFTAGELINLGTLNIPGYVNANNVNSKIYNYGTITAQGLTFPGLIENHGTLDITSNFSIQSSSNTMINTGTVTVGSDFNVDAGLDNRGTINVFGGKLQVNSNAFVTNTCTIDFNTGVNNTLVIDGELYNKGALLRGGETRINSGGKLSAGEGSELETEELFIDGGICAGPTVGCTKLNVSNWIQGNNNNISTANITGNVHLCGISITDVNAQLLGSGVVESCISCEAVISNNSVTLTWDDGFQGATRTNLSAGTYHVTGTCDASNCTIDETIIINSPEGISVNLVSSTNPSEIGVEDGTATVMGVGGTGIYSYSWTGGVTGATNNNLSSGITTVTITDENGCTETLEVTLGEGPLGICDLPVKAVYNAVICEGGTGVIRLMQDGENTTGNNGTGTGFQCQEAPAPAEDYCAACTELEQGNNVINVNSGELKCIGANFTGGINQNGGRVVICESGATIQNWNVSGVGEAIWMGGATINSMNLNTTTVKLINHATGTDTVKILGSGFNGQWYNYGNLQVSGDFNVNDKGLLENYGSITVDQSSMISSQFFNYGQYIVSNLFHINSNGYVENNCTISANSANIDDDFINRGNLTLADRLTVNSSAVISLESGSQIITDKIERLDALVQGPAEGCAKLEVNTLLENSTGGLEGNISLCGTRLSTITQFTVGTAVTEDCQSCIPEVGLATGDEFAWLSTYMVDYGTLAPYVISPGIVQGVPAGTYQIIIKTTTCQEIIDITFTQGTTVLEAQVNYSDQTSQELCNGVATVHITKGTPNYSYTWTLKGLEGQADIEIQTGTSSSKDELCSGSYEVLVEDEGGCNKVLDFVIGSGTPPDSCQSEIKVELSKNLAESCDPGNDGQLEIRATGGTGGYDYQWSNGNTTSSLSNLKAGEEYTITVTDKRGLCLSISDTFIVRSGYDDLNVQIGIDPSSPSCDGSISIKQEAGHTYNWSDGCEPLGGIGTEVNTTNVQTGLCAGVYSVDVTGENGCVETYTIQVGFDNEITITDIITSTTDVTTTSGGSIALDVSDNYTNLEDNSKIITTEEKESDCDRLVEGNIQDLNIDNETVCVAKGSGVTHIENLNVNGGGKFVTFSATSIGTMNLNANGSAVFASGGSDIVGTINSGEETKLTVNKTLCVGTYNAAGVTEITGHVDINILIANPNDSIFICGEVNVENLQANGSDIKVDGKGSLTVETSTINNSTLNSCGETKLCDGTTISNSEIIVSGIFAVKDCDPTTGGGTNTITQTTITVIDGSETILDDVTLTSTTIKEDPTNTGENTITVTINTTVDPITGIVTGCCNTIVDDPNDPKITIKTDNTDITTITTTWTYGPNDPDNPDVIITVIPDPVIGIIPDNDPETCEYPLEPGICGVEWTQIKSLDPNAEPFINITTTCQILEDVPAGEYLATLIRCPDGPSISVGPIVIEEMTPLTVKIEEDPTTDRCDGSSHLDLSLTITGGLGTETIVWSGPGITEDNQGRTSLTNLPFGTYSVMVSDASDESITSADVFTPSELFPEVTFTTGALPTCGNSSTGSISASLTGLGLGDNLTYRWRSLENNQFTFSGSSRNDVPVGEYEIAITDLNECVYKDTVEVTEGLEDCPKECEDAIITTNLLNGTSTQTSTDGAVEVNVAINEVDITNFEVSPNPEALPGGSNQQLTVEIQSDEGDFICERDIYVNIPMPDGPIYTPKPCDFNVLSSQDAQETCLNESNDGAISLVITGTLDYKVVWEDLFGEVDPTLITRTNLSAGRYRGSVIDLEVKGIVPCSEPFSIDVSAATDYKTIRIRNEEDFKLCSIDKASKLTLTANQVVRWFDTDDKLIETAETLTVDELGTYYARHEGESCDDFAEPVIVEIKDDIYCIDGEEPGLLCAPFIAEEGIEVVENCEGINNAVILAEAQYRYNNYRDSLRKAFREGYVNGCLQAQDQLDIYYTEEEYQYTLYYYDQAGNLVKTVPPVGVKPLKVDIVQTILDKEDGYEEITTEHEMETRYVYNSLNQLVAQNVPDHRTMNISEVSGEEEYSIPQTYKDLGYTVTSLNFDGDGDGYMTLVDPTGTHTGEEGIVLRTADFGQTWTTPSRLGLNNLNDVNIGITNIDMTYAVGDRGTYAQSIDGGLSWEVYPVGTAEDLIAVAEQSTGEVEVVSQHGIIWSFDVTAHLWTSVNATPLNNWELTEVHYDASNNSYYGSVKNSGKGGIAIYAGGTWAVTSQENIEQDQRISYVENTTIKYIGSTNGKLYKSTGGSTWERISTGEVGSIDQVHIYGGSRLSAIIGGALKYSYDGGSSWSETKTSSGASITGVTTMQINDNTQGGVVYNNEHVYYTRDGGFSVYADHEIEAYIGSTYLSPREIDEVVTGVVVVEPTNQTLQTGIKITYYNLEGLSINLTGDLPSGLVPEGVESITLDPEYEILLETTTGSYKLDFPVIYTGLEQITWQTEGTTNIGYQVETIPTDAYSSASLPLESITKLGTTLYGAGEDGTVLRTTGSILEELNLILTEDLTAIVAVATPVGLSIGTATGRTVDGGVTISTTGTPVTERVTGEGVSINSTDFAGLGSSLIYVGDNGLIIESNIEVTPIVTDNLNGITTTSGTTLIVGDGGKILRRAAGESTWICVTDVAPLELNGSDMVTKSIGYGVGAHGTVVKTTDGGSSWTNLNAETTTDLYDTKFISVSKGLVVGDGGLILRTTDGGANFTDVSLSSTNTLNGSTKLGSDILLVGDNGSIIYTKDAMTTSQELTVSGEDLYGVQFQSAKLAYAVGANGTFIKLERTTVSSPFTATNVGVRINIGNAMGGVDEFTFKTDKLNAVYFIDRETGYVAGDGGAIYKTIDGGDTWIAKSGPSYVPTGANENLITEDIEVLNFVSREEFYVSGSNGSLNRILDEGDLFSTKFWYDELGRLVVSQHTRQNNEGAFSYTRYDHLGRIVEVGEVHNAPDIRQYVRPDFRAQITEDQLIEWLAQSPERRDVNKTVYDVVTEETIPNFTQDADNMRNRVSSVYYFEDAHIITDNPIYNHATHYTYDVHGNVDQMVQDIPELAVHSRQYFTLSYDYDLISGNVHEVIYQEGRTDQFIHKYAYDADNRIVDVKTSRDGVVFDQDAKYDYYRHGPLARTEMGEHDVQGQDYAYTIHGWLKGVNSESLASTRDIGKDGLNRTISAGTQDEREAGNFAPDEYGFSLSYYEGDYSAVTQSNQDFLMNVDENSDLAQDRKNLYNGNIGSMVTGIRAFMKGGTAGPNAMNYTYDQLNRLKTATNYQTTGTMATNTWTGTTKTEAYNVALTYDKNGNITTLDRTGVETTHKGEDGVTDIIDTRMDELSYVYEDQHSGSGAVRRTNRLLYVNDGVDDNNYGNDIDDQMYKGQTVAFDNDKRLYNYDYDEIGNLTQDLQDGIEDIEWNVQNKVKRVVKNNGPDLVFNYAADGNRLKKEVRYNTSGSTVASEIIKRTYYIRDASGNVMANYEVKVTESTSGSFTGKYIERLNVNEHNIYGSSMCGQYHHEAGLSSQLSTQIYSGEENEDGSVTPIEYDNVTSGNVPERSSILGSRYYQVSNHLGNVLTVVSDRKHQVRGANGMTMGFTAEVMSVSDYYPFGMLMPDRDLSSEDYRYGFNGMERDDEYYGGGNAYDYGARQYDSRLGRWFGLDAYMSKYPSMSPYTGSGNSPICMKDIDGKDIFIFIYASSSTESGAGHVAFAIGQNQAALTYYSMYLKSDGGHTKVEDISFEMAKRYDGTILNHQKDLPILVIQVKTSKEVDDKMNEQADKTIDSRWLLLSNNCSDGCKDILDAGGFSEGAAFLISTPNELVEDLKENNTEKWKDGTITTIEGDLDAYLKGEKNGVSQTIWGKSKKPTILANPNLSLGEIDVKIVELQTEWEEILDSWEPDEDSDGNTGEVRIAEIMDELEILYEEYQKVESIQEEIKKFTPAEDNSDG